MNFVGPDSFSVAYPAWTLKGRGVITSETSLGKEAVRNAEQEYISYGYDITRNARAWSDGQAPCLGWRCLKREHYFGDKGCMTTFFNPKYVLQESDYRPILPYGLGMFWILGGSLCDTGDCQRKSWPVRKPIVLRRVDLLIA